MAGRKLHEFHQYVPHHFKYKQISEFIEEKKNRRIDLINRSIDKIHENQ